MYDEKAKFAQLNTLVTLRDEAEVREWCNSLGCTESELREALNTVGCFADTVREYLLRR